MAWYPAEADTSAFVAQCPEEIHDLANERVVGIFALNCLQARHWVRVDYDIVLYRVHVPIVVQCQGDGCCLSGKDGTVIWESFGQLAASRLTILEMAVDDRYCPHSLVNLRSVSVDFIMRSLSIAILSEFGLSLFSCDHTFAHPFNKTVSLRIVFMRSWRKGWCLQGAVRFYVIPAEVMTSSTLRPMGCVRGWVSPPFRFGLRRYRSLVFGSNSCSAWCAAGLSVQARVCK